MTHTDPFAFAQRIEAAYGDKFAGLTTRVISADDSYPTNRRPYAEPGNPYLRGPLILVEWTTTNAKTASVRKSVFVPIWGWDNACAVLDKKLKDHRKAPVKLVFEAEVAAILRHYTGTDSLADIAAAIRKAGAHDRQIVGWQDQAYADKFAGDNPLFVNSASVGPLAIRAHRGVQSLKDLQAHAASRTDDKPSLAFAFRQGLVNFNLWHGSMRWDTAARTVYLFGDLPDTVVAAAMTFLGNPLGQYVDAPFAKNLLIAKVLTHDTGSCGAKIRLVYKRTGEASSVKEKA